MNWILRLLLAADNNTTKAQEILRGTELAKKHGDELVPATEAARMALTLVGFQPPLQTGGKPRLGWDRSDWNASLPYQGFTPNGLR